MFPNLRLKAAAAPVVGVLGLLLAWTSTANAQILVAGNHTHVGVWVPNRYRWILAEQLANRQALAQALAEYQYAAALQERAPWRQRALQMYKRAQRADQCYVCDSSGKCYYHAPASDGQCYPADEDKRELVRSREPDPPPTDEQSAQAILKLARAFMEDRQYADADEFAQRVVTRYPQTDAAEEARDLMRKLREVSTEPVPMPGIR